MLELMPPFYFLTFAKVSVSVSKKFGLKKVSVSVSKTFGLEKSLGIGLDEFFWSRHSVVLTSDHDSDEKMLVVVLRRMVVMLLRRMVRSR